MERTGQVEKASEAYDFAHKVEPSNSMPLIHKGLMMMQSNVVEGVKLLEQAVSVEPDCFPVSRTPMRRVSCVLCMTLPCIQNRTE